MKDSVSRALHTLWQAGAASGVSTVAVQSFAASESADIRHAILLAGTALGAAVLSAAKSQGVKVAASVGAYLQWKRSPVHVDPAVIDAAVQRALADVKAHESVRAVMIDAAKTVAPGVTVVDPYLASK